jgi:UDP-3-O-[3-hydroxymyristoyl] N-acetylglucosamine deacetylase
MGLGKGGSLDNAIIVSGNKILNQGGLRYENEFVKHKVLDCIGDLYLAEYPIIGKVKTLGGGHELNLMLLREIFKDKKNYEIIDLN